MMTELLAMTTSQFVNQAGLLILSRQSAVVFQIFPKTSVVAKPPKGRFRDQEEVGALGAEGLELGNRFLGRGRVNVGVLAVDILRKVPGSVSIELEQLVVSFANDQDIRR